MGVWEGGCMVGVCCDAYGREAFVHGCMGSIRVYR